MPPTPTNKRTLVIIPHQDDEVLGMGGWVAAAAREAAAVHLVLVTDGAADGGVKSLLGEWPCTCLADAVDEVSEGIAAHDALLVRDAEGNRRHQWNAPPPFPIVADPERAPGFACPVWGRQRDIDFIDVALALGVPRQNILFAYWDPECPVHIKDGQVAVGGARLTPGDMIARYETVARHYIERLAPDVVMTMAPYEFIDPPNDHWAIAHGVQRAAAGRVERLHFSHSGLLYTHLQKGGAPAGEPFVLSDELWETKRRAMLQYFRWNPAQGHFATAAHSVARTFAALFAGQGRTEYFSNEPIILQR